MQDVKVPVYKNDKGEELKTPELKTEQVPQYVSTNNPTAWAYVPATCANKGGCACLCGRCAIPVRG